MHCLDGNRSMGSAAWVANGYLTKSTEKKGVQIEMRVWGSLLLSLPAAAQGVHMSVTAVSATAGKASQATCNRLNFSPKTAR